MTIIEIHRLMRLWLPKRHDHAAWMLMNIVGRWWLLTHGWKREYHIYSTKARRGVIVDFAHPSLGLVIEADGTRYHRDIVHEQERDEVLQQIGWVVWHYRYPDLAQHPAKVRRQVRRWYWRCQIMRLAVGVQRRLS